MKILIAPDSFKGSISAIKAAKTIKEAILSIDDLADTILMPVADGGEGTIDAIACCVPVSMVEVPVCGPMGEDIMASYAILEDGKTAVIEMAKASGLPIVPPEKRNPLIATTYGTGQLISHALDRGCKKMIIGIGGSATNDGGAGALMALGAALLDDEGNEIARGGAALKDLARIDLTGFDDRISDTEIIVACDVTNPLTGPHGASFIYGPQKGADSKMVRDLDAALLNFSLVSTKVLNEDYGSHPGAGAAGGLGFALLAYCKARFAAGIDIVLDVCNFEKELRDSDLVITGEGKIDGQSVNGKVLYGIGQRAKKAGVPVIAFAGASMPDGEALTKHGITAMFSIANAPATLEYMMDHGEELLWQNVRNVMRVLKISSRHHTFLSSNSRNFR